MTTKKKYGKRKALKKKSSSVKVPNIPYEIVGAFLFVISILLALSLLSDNMGIFGKGMSQGMVWLSGAGAWTIPIFLFLWGGTVFLHRVPKKRIKIRGFLIWAFLAILVLYDHRVPTGFSLKEKLSYLNIEFQLLHSGGQIGAVLGYGLYRFIGTLGTRVFLFLGTVCAFLMVLEPDTRKNIPGAIHRFFSQTAMTVKSGFNKKKESKSEKESTFKGKRKTSMGLQRADDESENRPPKMIGFEEESGGQMVIQKENFDSHKKKTGKKGDLPGEKEIEKFSKEMNQNADVNYTFPSVDLLSTEKQKSKTSKDEMIRRGEIIEETMENFGIRAKVVAINRGPSVTSFELEPAPGVRLNRIVSLADNLSLALASADIRIEAPIPGKSAVGIEVPNHQKDMVSYRSIVESPEFLKAGELPLALGKDVTGNIVVSSIDKMPHLLIAGATGSGKSVCINTILMNILFKSSPQDVRLILIDPKVVELSAYNGIPHLLIPVVTDPKKAAFALNWAVGEMERRYQSFAKDGVKDIKSFNRKVLQEERYTEKMPKIVVVVDELADLMMVAAKEVEEYIARLAQMARAAGIYLIIATQRPSVDVITGTIKANIPSRIAFAVSSSIDSRTILDSGGAEKLLGQGDMLFAPSYYSKPKRLQGAFISDEEVHRVISFIKPINEGEYDQEIMENLENSLNKEHQSGDPLIGEAISTVLRDEQASVSYLQRKLKVGYSRAARLIDDMEEMGILGPHEGSKPRKILLSEEEKQEILDRELE